MSEEEALRFLGGHRIRPGDRTMDPKAQIVGEFVESIRVLGYFPPELRQQLRTMVTLPSVGSTGDSYASALAETVIGLCETEEIHRRGPWKGLEDVELRRSNGSRGTTAAACSNRSRRSAGRVREGLP